MKKLIALTLALMLALTLAACGGNGGTTPPADNTPTPSQNDTQTPSDNGGDTSTPTGNNGNDDTTNPSPTPGDGILDNSVKTDSMTLREALTDAGFFVLPSFGDRDRGYYEASSFVLYFSNVWFVEGITAVVMLFSSSDQTSQFFYIDFLDEPDIVGQEAIIRMDESNIYTKSDYIEYVLSLERASDYLVYVGM